MMWIMMSMMTMMMSMMMMMANLAGEGEPASFSVEEERTSGEVEEACWNIIIIIRNMTRIIIYMIRIIRNIIMIVRNMIRVMNKVITIIIRSPFHREGDCRTRPPAPHRPPP